MDKMEVEDIMCDQSILYPEVNVQFASKISCLVISASKLWVAIDILLKSIFPPISSMCCMIFRNPHATYQNVRHQLFPTLVAFIANTLSNSLASVQNLSLPVTLRITKDHDGCERAVISDDATADVETERSVECVVLHEPEQIAVDVVFIHGLHGGLDKTWKQGTWRTRRHKLVNQTPVRRRSTANDFYVPTNGHQIKTWLDVYSKIPNKVHLRENKGECTDIEMIGKDFSECWPKDWLPKDCPDARIIAVNYTTDVLWTLTWTKQRRRTNLVDRSNEMINELMKLNVGGRPIIWVGHSKGGLYIKQILINVFENAERKEEVARIFNQTKAIMWYSVPHKGSSLADFTLPLLRRSIELLEVQRNGSFVLELHRRFLEIINKEKSNIEIFSFIETSFTYMVFIYLKIVAYQSADPDIGIKCDVPLDHREICKPAGRDCFLYLELIKLIKKCLSIPNEANNNINPHE
ncbi:unnamed protein product [Phyllotreta striolata]|uniref:Protein SERAC1 n=1 Tax=Phyllotreta striolata TaxID=444603 RepID=A0A9N9TH58_PHYSR|nr:unnamed protein product [Phyllotreta striolata]